MEQAHWFYEDNSVEQNPSLRSLSFKEFTVLSIVLSLSLNLLTAISIHSVASVTLFIFTKLKILVEKNI
jgi:Dcp2, box A domain